MSPKVVEVVMVKVVHRPRNRSWSELQVLVLLPPEGHKHDSFQNRTPIDMIMYFSNLSFAIVLTVT